MFKITTDYSPTDADNNAVREGLISVYEKEFGERDKPVSVFLKDDSGKVFGDIQAFLDTQSIYIDAMWVDDSLRKKGYGTKLLAMAEQEAIKNCCVFSTTDTWSFQAEGFYLKNGYKRIGEIKNYWLEHSRIFLRKNLK